MRITSVIYILSVHISITLMVIFIGKEAALCLIALWEAVIFFRGHFFSQGVDRERKNFSPRKTTFSRREICIFLLLRTKPTLDREENGPTPEKVLYANSLYTFLLWNTERLISFLRRISVASDRLSRLCVACGYYFLGYNELQLLWVEFPKFFRVFSSIL
jgi:hypothetical protein